jgi:hypothetical protein
MKLDYNFKTSIKECELQVSGLLIIATNNFIKFIANNTTIVKLNCSTCYKITDDELISLVTTQPANAQTLRYFMYTRTGDFKLPTVKKMLKMTQNLKFYLLSGNFAKIQKIVIENPTRFFVEG